METNSTMIILQKPVSKNIMISWEKFVGERCVCFVLCSHFENCIVLLKNSFNLDFWSIYIWGIVSEL